MTFKSQECEFGKTGMCLTHGVAFMCRETLAEVRRGFERLYELATGGPIDATRCLVCGWSLAASADQGCVPGNCSYRTANPEQQRQLDGNRRIEKAWAALNSLGR